MSEVSSLAARELPPEELEALRGSVMTALARECGSLAVHGHIDGRSDVARRLWRQAVDLGWLAIGLPEAHGGLGLGAVGIAMLCRELGAVAAPGPFIPSLCGLQWLSRIGGNDIMPLIERVVGGEASMAIPAREACPALDLDAGRLSGRIELLAGGDAPMAIVPFGTGADKGWALVDLAGDGVQTTQTELWDRTRGMLSASFNGATADRQFADVDGKAGELLGTFLSIALSADCVGAAQAITDKTIAYLKERVQFERPIASFQAIKHRTADLITKIASQEGLLLQAVESLDRGSLDAAMWARLAKAGASEAAAFITGDCIILFGGVGHTWEYDAHIYTKRARLNQFLLADNGTLRSGGVKALAAAIAEGRTTVEMAA